MSGEHENGPGVDEELADEEGTGEVSGNGELAAAGAGDDEDDDFEDDGDDDSDEDDDE